MPLGLHRRRDQSTDLTSDQNDDNLDIIESAIAAAGGGPGAPVTSVNGHTGVVDLDASDVGASPVGHSHGAAAAPSTPGFMTGADKSKLDGIAPNATANAPDASLLNRANHTGTQAMATVSGLQVALDGKAAVGSLPADGSLTLLKLAQSGASVGQVPVWDGEKYAPGTPAAGGQTIYVRPEEQAGATTEDKLSAAIAAAISLGRPLLLSAVYSITSALTTATLSDGQTLHFVGDGSILVAANIANPLVIQAIWPSALAVTAVTLTTHLFPGDSVAATECTKITVPGHSFAIGDLAHIVAEDAIPGSTLGPSSAPRRIGEKCYVGDVSGNDIFISGFLIESYATSPRIVKVPQKARLIWDGPTIDHTAGQAWNVTSLLVRGLYRPYIRTSIRNGYHCGLQLQSTFQAEIDVDGSRFLDRVSSQGIAGYVVQDIGGFQTKGVVDAMDARHAYTTGSNSTASTGSSPYLYGRTIGARIGGAAIGCSSAAFDAHSEAIDCAFEWVSVNGGILGEDSNGSGIQMRGRNNKSIGATVRNSPHGAQFYAQVEGDCLDNVVSGLDYFGLGDGIRFGSPGSSIKSKRNRVLGGSFRVDNNRAVYAQNTDGLVIEGGYFALTGAQTAPNLAILDGAASVTLRRCTLDLTDYAGSASVDYAAFAAASTLNILEIEEPIVIDPNGKLRSWFNAANTSGVIVLKDIPKNVPLASGSAIINGDGLDASSITYRITDGDTIAAALLTGNTPDAVKTRMDSLREAGASVYQMPMGRAFTTHPDTGEPVFNTPADMRDSFLGLPGLYEIKAQVIEWSGAARNLALTDDRMVLRATHATPTLTIRNDSNVPYPAGMMLAGTSLNPLTIAMEAGVTINGQSAPLVVAQESLACGFSLRKNAMANSWTMVAGLVLPDAPAYTAPTTVASAILSLLEATANGTNKANIRPAAAMAADADITLPGISGTLALLSQVLRPDTSTALAVGYDNTEFSLTLTGTVTPAVANGYKQKGTNNAAFTLAVPAGACDIQIDITNGATAGAITFSGFTQVDNVGDLDTINGHKFRLYISTGTAGSHVTIKRMV